MFIGNHVTYAVNSIGHYFGRRRFDTPDESRNVAWLSIISFGESWHNNHHAFPRSANHGMRWYEVDLSRHHHPLHGADRHGVGRHPDRPGAPGAPAGRVSRRSAAAGTRRPRRRRRSRNGVRPRRRTRSPLVWPMSNDLWQRLTADASRSRSSAHFWVDGGYRARPGREIVRDAEAMTAGLRAAGVTPGHAGRGRAGQRRRPPRADCSRCGSPAGWSRRCRCGCAASTRRSTRCSSARICEHLDAVLLLADEATVASLPPELRLRCTVRSFESFADSGRVDPAPPGADEPAFIQYSSGSTSAPKGCVLTPSAIANQLDLLAELVDARPGEAGVGWLPWSHDMGLFGGLLTGWWNDTAAYISTPERFIFSPTHVVRGHGPVRRDDHRRQSDGAAPRRGRRGAVAADDRWAEGSHLHHRRGAGAVGGARQVRRTPCAARVPRRGADARLRHGGGDARGHRDAAARGPEVRDGRRHRVGRQRAGRGGGGRSRRHQGGRRRPAVPGRLGDRG